MSGGRESDDVKKRTQRFFGVTGEIAVSTVLCTVALILIGLLISAMVATTTISITDQGLETLSFLSDQPIVSLLLLVVGLLALLLTERLIRRIPYSRLGALAFFLVLISGTVFVLSARSFPTHDSFQVTQAGVAMRYGDASPLSTKYFIHYPFQLGYVLWTELLSYPLVHGGNYLPLQIPNVICLAVASFALVQIARLLFHSPRTSRLLVLLILLFPQGIWFCTFLYGNVPAYCFAMLGVWMLLRYFERERWRDLLLCALFLLIAVWLKLNSLIVFVACVICLLVHLWQKRRIKLLPGFLILLLCVPLMKDLPVRLYEARTDIEFGTGIPMAAWASMGLHTASGNRPGWYNGNITVGVYEQYGRDAEKTIEHSMANIKKRLEHFASEPADAVDFFGRKVLSQWNEPTFQSIWNVQVRGSYGKRVGIAKAVCDEAPDFFAALCDLMHGVNLLGAAVGTIALLRRRRAGDMLLPLIFLGGFLYHLIFEAKSQYVLIYMMTLLPIAAYGYRVFFSRLRRLAQGVAGHLCSRSKEASHE